MNKVHFWTCGSTICTHTACDVIGTWINFFFQYDNALEYKSIVPAFLVRLKVYKGHFYTILHTLHYILFWVSTVEPCHWPKPKENNW